MVDFTCKRIKSYVKNSIFFYQGTKENIKKKDRVWSEWWIWLYKGKERIESKELGEKKGLGSMVDLILYRNRTNCEEKNWGLEPMVDLILVRN